MTESNEPRQAAIPTPRETPPTDDVFGSGGFSLVKNIEVELTLEIGRRKMRIADVIRLAEGQTLELSKAAGEPLDLYVNGRLLGRGEACVIGDRYAVRVTEIMPLEQTHR